MRGQRLLSRQSAQGQVIRIQHHKVRALAGRQAPHRHAAGPRAASHGLQRQDGGGVGLRFGGADVAGAAGQELVLLEQHYFFSRVDADVAVKANAPSAARVGRAIGLVVHVLKLAPLGGTGFEHLDVGPGGRSSQT